MNKTKKVGRAGALVAGALLAGNAAAVIGNFTHNNFAIRLPSITGADLALNIGFPGESAEVNFSLAFEHIETPNETAPRADGGVPLCPDAVVVSNVSERVTFADGAIYDFEIIGFSQDGGSTLTSRFLTQEESIIFAFGLLPAARRRG